MVFPIRVPGALGTVLVRARSERGAAGSAEQARWLVAFEAVALEKQGPRKAACSAKMRVLRWAAASELGWVSASAIQLETASAIGWAAASAASLVDGERFQTAITCAVAERE